MDHRASASRAEGRRGADPGGEGRGGLRTGDEVPPLLGHDPRGHRVPLGQALGDQPVLPLAEVQLAQVGLDPGPEAGGVEQRLRRLQRAAQRRHVDGVDTGLAQPASHRLRLYAPEWRQRGIALSVVEPGVGAVGVRGHDLAVADEEHVGGGGAVLCGHRVILPGRAAPALPISPRPDDRPAGAHAEPARPGGSFLTGRWCAARPGR